MVELEIKTEEEPIREVEVELTLDQVIYKALCGLDEEGDDIVIIDYAFVESFFDSIENVNTIRRLIDVPNLNDDILKVFSVYEEEIRSTKQSKSLIKIFQSLFSNTEIDYYTIHGVSNAEQ